MELLTSSSKSRGSFRKPAGIEFERTRGHISLRRDSPGRAATSAGHLHGLRGGLALQRRGGVLLQQAVQIVAAATAVHGGGAGRRGGARAGQTSHSCRRHWARRKRELRKKKKKKKTFVKK